MPIWHSVRLWPPATVQATASLSPSNQSSTNWPLYRLHVEVALTRTTRAPGPPAWLRLRGRGLPAPALAAAGRGPAGSPLRGSAGLRRSGRAGWEGTAASPSAGAGNCECYQIYHGTMNVLLPSTRPPRLHYSLPPPLDARFQMTRQRRQADVCAGRGPGKDVVQTRAPHILGPNLRARARALKTGSPISQILWSKLLVGASTFSAPPSVLSVAGENRGTPGAEEERTSLRRPGDPSRSYGSCGTG
ncbi:uncharacterized protein LOC121034039 [Herpailurus yagouaroundi]|uniref:uncharacterized protein LOC121034039 n=1 Tax=Herpailurus yagouaroundi TaxID=1608482 RepID=UPI001AD69A80|nr:uncharacterized protein LOC121034039 [Puma yagouaroundi]